MFVLQMRPKKFCFAGNLTDPIFPANPDFFMLSKKNSQKCSYLANLVGSDVLQIYKP